jgi:hypothetical protein
MLSNTMIKLGTTVHLSGTSKIPDINLVNKSIDYLDNRVDEELHPGLSASGITYSSNHHRYLSKQEDLDEDAHLVATQEAFAEALRSYEEGADQKYKTGINLQNMHTWDDVMKQVESARTEYVGMGEEGIKRTIRHGFRNFEKAAPAINAWLKLLPSNETYTSVLCGGIKLIIGVCRFSLSSSVEMALLTSQPGRSPSRKDS